MRDIKFLVLIFLAMCPALMRAEFIFAGKESRLKLIDPTTQFIVNTPMQDFNGTLYRGSLRPDLIQGRASIHFNNGCFDGVDSRGVFSGVFDPQNSDILRLSGDDYLTLNGSGVLLPVYVSGQRNLIQGVSFFNYPITLVNADSKLTLALFTPLNQPVYLNGGTVILAQDLAFSQAGALIGHGTLDGQACILTFPEHKIALNGDLLLRNLSIMQLRDTVELSGTWSFSSSLGISVIDGGDNLLDISQNGALFVAPGNELVLKNTVLRGLGTGKIIFGDSSSRLVLVGSALELSTSFTFSYGSVEIRSESSMAIVGENSLGFSGTAQLVLNGADFMFDALTASNLIGVVAAPANVQLLGGGKILARVQDASGPALLFSHRSNVLLQSEVLTVNRTMSFSLTGVQPVVLDGHGFSLKFPQLKKPVITIADGQSVVFKNIRMEGFYPEHIALGVGSKIFFDDDTTVIFGGDATLSYQIKCIGNCTLGGAGSVITLSSAGSVSVADDKKLRLVNMVIKGIGQESGKLLPLGPEAMIACVDVDLYLESNYSFSTGKMYFSSIASKIVTGAYLLTFDHDAQLVVDGISVLYDTQSAPDNRNIRPFIPDEINYVALNGGTVRSFSSLGREGDMLLDQAMNTLVFPESLGSARRMIFRGSQALDSVMTLNGNGYVLQMPGKVTNVIVIPDGKKVLIKNVVLRDFLPDHIFLGVDASISFGEGVVLQLADDAVLSHRYDFSGNCVIDGRYKMLDIGTVSSAGIRVSHGASVRIVNTYLMSVSGAHLSCADSSSVIQLASSSVYMADDVHFEQGSIDIFGDVTFAGPNKEFNFKSDGAFTIKQNAQLYLDSSVSFVYDNPLSTVPGMVFEDATARLFLHGANLASRSSALTLRKGTIFVDGYSAFKTNPANHNALILVEIDANVKVQTGGILDVCGNVVGR